MILRVLFSLAFVCLAFGPTRAYAATAERTLSYGSDGGTVYTRLWYPDGLEVIRGVLVFTDGGAVSSGDTRGITGDAFWQRFAAHFGFALLGNQFTTHYKDAVAYGSGQGLLDSLAGLAADTNHPELVHAPLVLKGTSNGGYFSFTFAHWQPARVIAFCVNKSGYTTAPLDPPLLAIPGLLVWGSAETAATPTIIHSLVQQGRALHALWAEVKEWGRDHEEGTPQQLYAPFFAEMIAARYPTSADPRAGDVALLALTEESGWLGDHADASVESNLPTIAAYADYTGDKLAASWLPSRSLATLWRGFVTKTPATLSAPALGAALEVDQASLLRATGLADGERASFLVGSMPLGAAVVATAGEAMFSWTPSASSATAVIAIVEDGSGTALRTTRPAQVVTYRTPPVAPMAGSGGMGGAAGSQAGVGGSAGSDPAAGSGGMAGTGGVGGENAGAEAMAGTGEPPEGDETAAPDSGSPEPDAAVEEPPDAGAGSGSVRRTKKRDQRVSGGGGCSVHGTPEQGSSAMTAGLAACLVWAARRRRRPLE